LLEALLLEALLLTGDHSVGRGRRIGKQEHAEEQERAS
jgi:hypothetical protein